MDWGISSGKDLLEAASYVAVLIGIPTALVSYLQAKQRQWEESERQTYDSLNRELIGWYQLCLNHPRLDIFDAPEANPADLSNAERKEEMILLTILISIFERAFLMYHDQRRAFRQRQWTGWDQYIRHYARRENFRRAWCTGGASYDAGFEQYMRSFVQC